MVILDAAWTQAENETKRTANQEEDKRAPFILIGEEQ